MPRVDNSLLQEKGLKLLIIGASGQLGRCLQARVQGLGIEVYTPLSAQLNLLDRQATKTVLQAFSPTVVINAAAYNAVDQAQTNVAAAFALNAEAPAWLARCTRQLGARLLHVSSDYVFDGLCLKGGSLKPCQSPYTEADATRPLNVYGESKRQGELAVLAEDASAVVVRTSWLYSEYGHNFVRSIVKLALQKQPLQVVADQVSAPTAAHDLAAALLAMAADNNLGGLWHFAGEKIMSRHQWAAHILHCLDELHGSQYAQGLQAITAADFAAAAPRPAYSALASDALRARLLERGLAFAPFATRLQQTVRLLLAS